MSNARRSIYLLPLVLGALAMADDAAAQSCPDHAQDQYRRFGRAAQRGAHLALRGEGSRLLRQALHRCQHHPVRRRTVGDLGGGGRAGNRYRERRRRRRRPRPEGAAVLGPGAPDAAGLHGGARRQDRGRPQGQEAQRDRRRGRRIQLAHGPRSPQDRGTHRRRRAIHRLRHRGPAAGPDRRPDRRRRAPSRGCLSRQEAEADAQSPGATRRADAELHVQRLRRLARLDRRATARCCAMQPPR